MELLQSASDDGGRFAIGGGQPEGLDTGFYIAPTIITDVPPDSRVATEEIFAPVMVVLTYQSEKEALDIVNSTEFGLNDAVYSADPERALRIARQMDSGSVNINNGQYLDAAIPFGGVDRLMPGAALADLDPDLLRIAVKRERAHVRGRVCVREEREIAIAHPLDEHCLVGVIL